MSETLTPQLHNPMPEGFFSDETLAHMERASAEHASATHHDLLAQIPEPKSLVVEGVFGGMMPRFARAEVIDYAPAPDNDRDPDNGTVIYYASHANGLDQNQSLTLDAIARVMPEHRVIGIGNPSLHFSNSVRMSPLAVADMVVDPSLTPLNRPVLQMLAADADIRPERPLIQTGHSLGGARSINASAIGPTNYNVLTSHVVPLDPVGFESLAPRLAPPGLKGLIALGRLSSRFANTDAQLRPAVAQSDSEAFKASFDETTSNLMLARYVAALGRLSNIATSRVMALGAVRDDLRTAIMNNPSIHASLMYGEHSELVDGDLLEAEADHHTRLLGSSEGKSVKAVEVPGAYHAFGNQIILAAGLVREGASAGR